MGAVAAGAMALGSIIASAASAVASLAATIVSAVTSVLSAVASGIAGAVDAIAGATLAVEAGTGAVAYGPVASALGTVISINTAVYSGVASIVSSISAAFKGFLEAIHYKVLLKVHKIAYILSADYREVMNKVYRQVGDISRDIFNNSYVVPLAIENARSIVLSVQSAMGKRFDLADAAWMKELQRFLKKWDEKTRKVVARLREPSRYYMDNPRELFTDLADWVYEPQIDNKANTQLTLFETVDTITDVTNRIAVRVNEIRTWVDQFVDDLPREIREEIKPYVDGVTDKIDKFIERRYRPYVSKIDDIISVIQGEQRGIERRMSDIVDRLTRPGDLLKGVDDLPESERLVQENKASEVVSRPYEREAEEIMEFERQTFETLEAIRQIELYQGVPPEWTVTEVKGAVYEPGLKPPERWTWFVGDY